MNYYDLFKSFLIGHSRTLDWFGNLFASAIGGIASFIAKVLKIKGNTIVWNQLVQNGNFADDTGWLKSNNATLTVSNGEATISCENADNYITIYKASAYRPSVTANHVYCISVTVQIGNGKLSFIPTGASAGGNVQFTGLTTKQRLTFFFKPSADAVWSLQFRCLLETSGVAENLSGTFSNYNCFDLTKMLGSTLADSIYSMEQSQSGSGVAYFRKLFPLDYYQFESGKLLNFGVAPHGTGKNLLNDVDSDSVNIPISVYAISDSKLVAQMSELKEGTYTLTIRYKVDSISEHVTNDFRYGCYVRFTNGGNNNNVNLQSDIPDVVVGQEYTKSATFTLTSEYVGKCTNFWFYCGRSTAQAGNNPDVVTFYHFQLEQGSSATPYEPYISNVSIKTVGKNLLAYDDTYLPYSSRGVTIAREGNIYHITSESATGYPFVKISTVDLPQGIYTGQMFENVSSSGKIGWRLINRDVSPAVVISSSIDTTPITFTTTQDYVGLSFEITTSTPPDGEWKSRFMLERGSTATSYEPYQSSIKQLPISTYFPNGMKSAGSVYDELTPNKAIKRVETRAYQSGDESDPSVTTDGTNTNYALTTPIETAITENLNYTVYSGGTETLLPIDDISTSPFSASIDYPSGNEDVYFTVRESGVFE